MNLMRRGRCGHVVTGNFAKKAWQGPLARQCPRARLDEDTHSDRIPEFDAVERACADDNLDYVYICQNNTIFGTQFHTLPNCGDTPLSSSI